MEVEAAGGRREKWADMEWPVSPQSPWTGLSCREKGLKVKTNRNIGKGLWEAGHKSRLCVRDPTEEAKLRPEVEVVCLHRRGRSFRTRFLGADAGDLMRGTGSADLPPGSNGGSEGGQTREGQDKDGWRVWVAGTCVGSLWGLLKIIRGTNLRMVSGWFELSFQV